jgi:hypothetical protein
MMKVLGIILISAFSLLLSLFSSFAQEESITFTTYYPAPYGVYNEMRLYPHTSTSCNASQEGLMYYDGVNHKLQVCGSGGSWSDVGSAAPQHAVMFFNLPSCPGGWAAFAGAQGRYIVGVNSSVNVGLTRGTPLNDGDNRPAGAHTHSFSILSIGSTGDYSAYIPVNNEGGNGPSSITTDYGSSLVPGTNAPYIQLLACEKQ